MHLYMAIMKQTGIHLGVAPACLRINDTQSLRPCYGDTIAREANLLSRATAPGTATTMCPTCRRASAAAEKIYCQMPRHGNDP